jgi:[ribosomal protein S5]-alanine N-acetyltransferase
MNHRLPVLMGRHVLLREPTRQDAWRLFEYASDPQVTRYLAFDTPRAVEDILGFISECERWRQQDREYVFVIGDRVTDEALGVIGLRHIDRQLGTAQVGTWVRRASWGTGVNREAKSLLFEFAFGTLGLNRIEARIATENERSRRAFEGLGARREGTLRESFRKKDVVLDQELYAILSSEWSARRPEADAADRPATRDSAVGQERDSPPATRDSHG